MKDEKHETRQDEIYSIRTDIVCNYYRGHSDSAIRELLAEFLAQKGLRKNTVDLFDAYLSRMDEHHANKILSEMPDEDIDRTKAMANQMLNGFPDITHDGAFNWNIYYFFRTQIQIPRDGVVLNQSIEVSCIDNRFFFIRFFCFMLENVTHPEQFLSFHLESTFKGEKKEYRMILKDAVGHVIKRKALLKQWIKDELNQAQSVESPEHSKAPKAIHVNSTYLDDIALCFEGKFENASQENIKSVLNGASSENKLIFEGAGVQLIGIFWALLENGLVNDSKEKIANWIAEKFQYTKKGNPVDFKTSTVIRQLGGNLKPKRNAGIESLLQKLKKITC